MRVAGDSDPIEPCLFLLLRDLMDHGIYQHLVAVILGGRGMGLGGGLLTRGGVAMARMVSVPVSSSLVVRGSSVVVIVTLVDIMAPLSAPVLSRSGEGGRGPSIAHASPILGPVVPDFF